MHFIRAGRGAPPLAFVHGYTCDHTDWKLQLDEFARSNEVVACDLRGHGATPGREHECSIEHYGGDVAALLANLELSNVILVGHSMGCRVVLEAARLDPARIAGLILIDGSRQGSGDGNAAEQGARAVIVSAGGYRAWMEKLVAQMFLEQSAEARRAIERALRLPNACGVALRCNQMRWDASQMDAALAALSCPLLAIQSTSIVAGGKRVSLQEGQSSPWLDLVRERVPGAQIEIVPGVGHFTQMEAPEAVNRLIKSFAQARHLKP
jgi:pimeloyl-ACP methyl ester carboxylesterase